tara:strand:- start:168782 stop:169882 length:1101 start_codon:yes stop_codon:yes gene_type:complete
MKKNYFYLVFLLIIGLVSCSDEMGEIESNKSIQDLRSNIIDEEEEGGGGGGGGGCTPDALFGSGLQYFHRGYSSSGLFYSKSTDGGASWLSGSVTVVGSTPQTSQGPAYVENNGNDFVYFKGNSSTNIFYIYKASAATTWYGNTWVRSDTKTSKPVSATKMGCDIYIAYKGESYDDIWVTKSSDGKTSWTTPVKAVTSGENEGISTGDGNPPYITSDGSKLYVFWVSEKYNGVYYKTSTDGVTWSSGQYINAYQNGAYDLASYGVAAVVDNAYMYVTYPKKSSKELVFQRIAKSSPYGSNASYITGQYTDQRPSLTLTTSGYLVVSYNSPTSTNDVHTSYVHKSGGSWSTSVTSGDSNGAPYISSY